MTEIHAGAPTTPAANDSLKDTATAIEQQLAKYIGERLTADQAKGLTVDVVLDKSNHATRRVAGNEDSYDIAFTFKSQVIHDLDKYKALEDKVLGALRSHPALNSRLTESVDQEIHSIDMGTNVVKPGEIHWKSLSLNKAQLEELFKPHPIQHGTSITGAATTPAEAHACDANCNHASPAKAEASPAQPETAQAAAPVTQNAAAPVATPAPEAAMAAPAKPQADAPAVDQPIGEVQPAGLAAAPVTQVAAPATHQGIAANKDKLAIGA